MAEFALGDQQVREIDRTLATLAEESDPLRLCFSNHWVDDDERPVLLAAALLGSLADKDYTVDAVDDEAIDGLLQFGVATALARRSEARTDFAGLTQRLQPSLLRMLWTPAALKSTNALFAEEQGEAAAFGPLNATFVDPHLSSAEDGQPDVVFLIRRWLTKRLAERLPTDLVRQLVDATAIPVDETLRNVREHAAGPWSSSPSCLLRISLAKPDRIRCSVLDTGIGLARSLQEKGVEPDLEPAALVCRLLDGKIEKWEAGRGTGLAYVAQLVEKQGGRLAVASDEIRVTRNAESCDTRADGFPLAGTVVDLTLPLSSN